MTKEAGSFEFYDLRGEVSENTERVMIKCESRGVFNKKKTGDFHSVIKEHVLFYSIEQGRLVYVRHAYGNISTSSQEGDFIVAHDEKGTQFYINKDWKI